FRAADGEVQARLVGHAPLRISDLDFSSDGRRILSGSGDATARLWDASTGAQLALLEAAQPVVSVRFRPDGALAATASLDETVRIWDAPGGRPLATAPRRGQPYAVRFSPDGALLLILPVDAPPALWRVAPFAGTPDDLARAVRCK